MSELIKKDYYELYDLYDKSKDDKERELIRKAVNEKTLETDDSNFQAYPEHSNKKFRVIVSR